MRINTSEARIKTCSVEVKALTISGKQVTLSVFRQLVRESVIDPLTGQFRGVPWGRVNYRWGVCAGRGQDHLHVVWQKEGELRRACVEPRAENDSAACLLLDNLADAQLQTCHLRHLRLGLQEPARWDKQKGGYVLGGMRVDFSAYPLPLLREYWDAIAPLPEDYPAEYASRRVQERKPQVEKTLAAIQHAIAEAEGSLSAHGIDPFPDDGLAGAARIAWDRLEQKITALRQGWAARYAELAALEQLFIAV